MVAITTPISTPLTTPRPAARRSALDAPALAPWQIALALLGVALVLVLASLPAVGGGGTATVPSQSVVAVSGDTMWSLAVEHAPAGEAASYVERLVAANESAVVMPGQIITLPAP